MRQIIPALVLAVIGASAASAQQSLDAASLAPYFDISLGYNYMNANAPPGQTNYFGLNGGYVSADLHVISWLSVTGQFTGGHAKDISLLGQDLTLMTYTAGPKVSFTGHRLVPFGQALFGGAHGSDSYFPSGTTSSASASSWALLTGGGLDYNLTERFGIRALDAEYLRTALPNGSTNKQNHLMIGAGVVIKFGGGVSAPISSRATTQRPSEILFTCGSNPAAVDEGANVEVTGHTLTEPDLVKVSYTWSSNGGKIEGFGRHITLNTAGLPPGDYHVVGRASLDSSPSTAAQCEAKFHVTGRESASSTNDASAEIDATQTAEYKQKSIVFHQNVQDALFDYDSAEIRPDAQAAIEHAAQYLKDNPAIRVRVGGYADERGSAEYNLVLGDERANAARNALIAAGIDPERIQIISYGKEIQICADETEDCWQQNRRAAFSLHP